MANEFVFDVIEGVRAFSAQFVNGIEKACPDCEAGLGSCALHGFQRGLGRIEDNAT